MKRKTTSSDDPRSHGFKLRALIRRYFIKCNQQRQRITVVEIEQQGRIRRKFAHRGGGIPPSISTALVALGSKPIATIPISKFARIPIELRRLVSTTSDIGVRQVRWWPLIENIPTRFDECNDVLTSPPSCSASDGEFGDNEDEIILLTRESLWLLNILIKAYFRNDYVPAKFKSVVLGNLFGYPKDAIKMYNTKCTSESCPCNWCNNTCVIKEHEFDQSYSQGMAWFYNERSKMNLYQRRRKN